MELDDALKNVAVIGAAGKMGSGISALLLQEIARLEAEKTGAVGSGSYKLVLIDSNEKSLNALRNYLKDQILKYAEKHIISLRRYYGKNEKLVSNQDIINAFVSGASALVEYQTLLGSAEKSQMIFEVIVEDAEAKVNLLNNLNNLNACIFTNTSSIPIGALNDAAHLKHRILGFHFYAPPVVQKLIEVVALEHTHPDLKKIALELAKRLEKTVVQSADIAGFIGNGHFIREALYAFDVIRQLAQEMPLEEAISAVNRMTQDFLVRPMGIIQLLDYVGLDVIRNIMRNMGNYSDEFEIQDTLLHRMVHRGIIGGQDPDGTQKPGFFQYNKHQITAVYSLERGDYVPLPSDRVLGPLPQGHYSWKDLLKIKEKNQKLEIYFQNLFKDRSRGSKLAQDYLIRSQQIAQQLVKSGVASSLDDVSKVLEYGFFHLYGPNSKAIKK